MPMSMDHGVHALTMNIKIGLGITPFGGLTLAGSQNWLDLLTATKASSGKRKPSEHENLKMNRQASLNEQKLAGKKTPEKKPAPRSKSEPMISALSIKRQIPEIHITRASNENIYELCLSTSSDEDTDSDVDEGEDCVYECPGMAAAGEDMTVENPLFNENLFSKSYRTPELPRKFWKDVFAGTV